MYWLWGTGLWSDVKNSVHISIITATYNAATTIADCLASVNAQTVPVEHIIIDGASTDNTLDIVREISPNAHIVSEPDNGIYDAMNKGLKLATGEVIGILNSDDFYPNHDTLAKVAEAFTDPEVEACYGDLLYVTEKAEAEKGGRSAGDNFKTVRYWRSGNYTPGKFYWGWMVPHPTFFVRRSVYERFGNFNLDLGSAADYEIMVRFLVKHRIKTAYIPEVLVKMRTGGVSNATVNNRIQANIMDRKAWEVNDLKPYPWTMLLKPIRKIPQWLFKG